MDKLRKIELVALAAIGVSTGAMVVLTASYLARWVRAAAGMLPGGCLQDSPSMHGIAGCSFVTTFETALSTPGAGDRILPAGTRLQIVRDEGSVNPTGRLLFVATEDGQKGWADIPAIDLGQCLTDQTACSAAGLWDLPEDIADARPVPTHQSRCNGPLDRMAPHSAEVVVSPTSGGAEVSIHGLEARCVQGLQGFVAKRGGQIIVLVQPEEMSPAGFAKCDCYYDVRVVVPLVLGVHEILVFYRSDRSGGETEPALRYIAGGEVAVGQVV